MSKKITNCIHCGKRKVLPKVSTSKTSAKNYVSPRVYEVELYCSRTCCEEHRAAQA